MLQTKLHMFCCPSYCSLNELETWANLNEYD